MTLTHRWNLFATLLLISGTAGCGPADEEVDDRGGLGAANQGIDGLYTVEASNCGGWMAPRRTLSLFGGGRAVLRNGCVPSQCHWDRVTKGSYVLSGSTLTITSEPHPGGDVDTRPQTFQVAASGDWLDLSGSSCSLRLLRGKPEFSPSGLSFGLRFPCVDDSDCALQGLPNGYCYAPDRLNECHGYVAGSKPLGPWTSGAEKLSFMASGSYLRRGAAGAAAGSYEVTALGSTQKLVLRDAGGMATEVFYYSFVKYTPGSAQLALLPAGSSGDPLIYSFDPAGACISDADCAEFSYLNRSICVAGICGRAL